MAKEISKLSIELDGIGHCISDNKLSVPLYQRSYAWEETHVTDLYDDLFSAIRNSEEEYFIGSVVISTRREYNEVVDGQQRIATITILLAAIRDHFISIKENDRADQLQNQYLSNRDRRTQEVIPNLKLNNADNDFFYNKIVIIPAGNEKPTKASHDRLLKASAIAKRKIANYIANVNNPIDSLLDLCDFIDDHLKIIVVKVPDHANAFTIFETLNDRGLELAISDLLKNFLLGQADNRILEVQDNWTKMYSLLENTENESLVVTFLRHYWSSLYGVTRERDLYKRIKERITSKQKAIDFSKNLESAARTYVSLIDTSSAFWREYSASSKSHMETLNLFGMSQVRPLLLAIMRLFDKKEIEKSLKFLVNVSVRFLIFGGLGGGALEVNFSERAKEISEGIVKNTKQLAQKMASLIPSDTQFKEAFKIASVSKQYLARYYLITLEKSVDTTKNSELIPNNDSAIVNLEHILPKSLSEDWNMDSDTHRAYLKRLGNLAILSSKLNSDIGNSSFNVKKKHLGQSSFSLTKMIAENKSWGVKEINERQKYMAELAVKTWKI